MHTSEYEHIKRGKESSSFYFFFIARASSFLTARDLRAIIFHCSCLQACTDPIEPSENVHQASLPVPLGRGRSQFTANHLGRELYALYALKKRLCMLCEDTTPKKTAYNAYRNANRRVRRAEGLKMYALKDAYRLHTKCIQAYKKSKREILPSTSSLYCLFSHPLLSAISGIHLFTACVFEHSRTPSGLIACYF